MIQTSQCWCGNRLLQTFSTLYLKCSACETLILAQMPESQDLCVTDDQRDFYGRHYYESYLSQQHGYPDLAVRARHDLPERCLHWLRTLLKYKLPPGKTLELGSAHGGFVALLHWAGFEATGSEMSPWVVEFARQTFAIPMLIGPVEDQPIPAETYDVIALMDVLEHFPDPIKSIRTCFDLLKPDGILLIQTPHLPENVSYQEMLAQTAPFLQQLKAPEHLYLFSQRAIQKFFGDLGAPYVQFEPAIFAHYDMFCVVSRAPFTIMSTDALAQALSATPSGRMVQAFLDVDEQQRNLQQRYAASEADRHTRLAVIEQQGQELSRLQGQVHQWLQEHQTLHQQALNVIHSQTEELTKLQENLAQQQQQNQELSTRLQTLQQEHDHLLAEHAALGLQVEQAAAQHAQDLQRQHEQLLAEHDTMRHQNADLRLQLQQANDQFFQIQQRLQVMQHTLHSIEHTRLYRLLRRLGRWNFMPSRPT